MTTEALPMMIFARAYIIFILVFLFTRLGEKGGTSEQCALAPCSAR